ncbi:hypothetical protein E3Q12_04271 [Wallemia mellicola]|nr:hypothetical protein E3Q12_04271 [Wallemia mellicola]
MSSPSLKLDDKSKNPNERLDSPPSKKEKTEVNSSNKDASNTTKEDSPKKSDPSHDDKKSEHNQDKGEDTKENVEEEKKEETKQDDKDEKQDDKGIPAKEAKKPDPSNPQGIVDMETFGQILEMDEDENDRDFSSGIVYNFYEQAFETFKELDTALKEEDMHTLHTKGHFLKGSSAALGLIKLKQSCEKIQVFGKLQDPKTQKEISKDEALKQVNEALTSAKDEYSEAEGWLKAFYGDLEWNEIYLNLTKKLLLNDFYYDGNALAVELLEIDDSSFNKPKSLIPSNILDTPFMHLLFIQCEDPDYYKSTLKDQIKEWIQLVSSKKHQEWLIVLISNSLSTKSNNLFKIKNSTLNKLKMDFNNQRCIQINRLGVNGIEDPNCWDPLIDKLKELTYIGFNTNIQMRLQDVEKSENQINLPGWNFCTFFILKESIALSYIGINLYNEALQIYSQLEQLFHHRLVDNSVISQFADFGGLGDSDDSGDLLSTTKKPYRQMMLSNSISIFDFRLYLFACQAKILGDLLGNIEQVATQSLEFINSFGQTIVSHSKDLKMNFLQYWKFTSSMSVIQQCDKWFTEEQKVNDIARARVFSQVKAQLYELAISQLKELGVAFGIIPNKYPFIRHLPNTKRDKRIPQTSNDQLKWALEQPKEFDKLFVQLCSSGARYYREVGKYKEAWSLDLLVAGLNM